MATAAGIGTLSLRGFVGTVDTNGAADSVSGMQSSVVRCSPGQVLPALSLQRTSAGAVGHWRPTTVSAQRIAQQNAGIQGLGIGSGPVKIGLRRRQGVSSWPPLLCLVSQTPITPELPEGSAESPVESSSSVLGGTENGLVTPSANGAGADILSYNGKSGMVSFRQAGVPLTEIATEALDEADCVLTPPAARGWRSLLWILGPLTLVASVVLPPLYLRKISEALLQDSLLTDFVILFFTESCFYAGVLVFLYLADKFTCELRKGISDSQISLPSVAASLPAGYKVSAAVSLALGILLPVVTLAVVWSWTGPAAAAALLPYILGLIVQLSFEQITRANNSMTWPVVPVIFQVYRLHQLNRAAQLVAGLVFSLRGAETTAETLAINGSLRTLLSILQLLGVLSLWTLACFLSYGFPSWSLQRWGESPVR